MGYKIVYEKQDKKKFPQRRIMILVLGVVITTVLVWPAGRRCLRELILPGDADVTAEALQSLAEDLSAGENLGDAVTAFCREIIAGGQ